jgi:hypothetical protein
MSIKSSDFRKATVNMRYCFQAFNELFSPFEQLIKNYSIDKMGVFGTSHGELANNRIYKKFRAFLCC